ncbi:hypothetical protein AAC03nite_36050 [Alicyclobacillus acidoterrestris]|nr:hypothetical protein AAC03nite_36050 [Alicyclobacillus acidoterrestris]
MAYKIETQHSTIGWRSETRAAIQTYENRLKDTSINEMLRREAQNKLKIARYRLKHDVPPVSNSPAEVVMTDSGLIETVIIFTIIIASDIVSGEFSSGTIKLLLIRPYRRLKILAAKYIASVQFATLMLGLLFFVEYATNAVLDGFGNIHATDLFLSAQGAVVQQNILAQAVKLFGLSFVPLMLYVTIAFAASTVLRSSAFSIGISLFIMLIGNSLVNLTMKFEWMKYLPFANSDMTLYLNHLPVRSDMTIGFSVGVLIAYIVMLNIVSCFVFVKRDIAG